MTVAIHHGLKPHHRAAAARLYWQAFGGKLGRVMGPDELAHVFLERVIRADHVIVALDENDTLLGLAGFKTHDGSFAGGSLDDLRSVYGRFGAFWRGILLQLLSREVDNGRFLMDGICVSREARGLGIGSLLVEAICDEAKARGYEDVRLDVVDTNFRARALYERLGFKVTRTDTLGPLRLVFGFSSATMMVRRVS